MKNGAISDQLKMQKQQIGSERKNTDTQVGMNADVQAELTKNKFTNKH